MAHGWHHSYPYNCIGNNIILIFKSLIKKSRKGYYVDEEDEEDYSPTSWDRQSDESDEDYQERTDDQESYLDYLNN